MKESPSTEQESLRVSASSELLLEFSHEFFTPYKLTLLRAAVPSEM